ncbi:hypothetical protein BGX21_002618 [Mortierella sp. AD011]|nr:hypothetical protein BGX20_010959 [Mortierella sp. AD010]KAF9401135.1 hypothetical protein BGX21_002618 [Mortierella sp. AD011]
MNTVSNLIQSTTGVSLADVSLESEQEQKGLEFQKSTVAHGRKAAVATVPPEIIQLIVNYLDRRELMKVLTLNWTWAQITAPKLWQEVNFTANPNRIVFLITKSVAPPNSHDQVLAGITPKNTSTAHQFASSALPPSSPSGAPSSFSENHPVPKRRNSYPWPTLLPYHSMVRSLNVSLSNSNVIQDLLDVIPCCTELRSFSILSTLPTEEFLFSGTAASAYNDALDPLGNSRGSYSSSSVPQSHRQSLTLGPYNRTTASIALQEGDDETISVSTASRCGTLLRLLASSCPKLEKIWFSGFHPISVLGKPTDLRSKPTGLEGNLFVGRGQDLDCISESGDNGQASFMDIRPPVVVDSATTRPSKGVGNVELPPIPPVQGIRRVGTPCSVTHSNAPPVPPVPVTSAQVQSKIHSLQFVNCSVPPQYLLTMIQHCLPNLRTLHLTQCWQGNPLEENFLESLAKICPGLREITLHSAQSHRGLVSSAQLLKMLQTLEGRDGKRTSKEPREESAVSLADFPLGTFTGSKYKNSAPSISSTRATVGTPSISMSSSSSSTSFVSAALSSATSSVSDLNLGSSSMDTYHQDHLQQETTSHDNIPRNASALESISVWFTHSILDQAIVSELANRKRHPKLKRVDFGSEESYFSGEDCIRVLREQRPELTSCTWVVYDDTCEDRDD